MYLSRRVRKGARLQTHARPPALIHRADENARIGDVKVRRIGHVRQPFGVSVLIASLELLIHHQGATELLEIVGALRFPGLPPRPIKRWKNQARYEYENEHDDHHFKQRHAGWMMI